MLQVGGKPHKTPLGGTHDWKGAQTPLSKMWEKCWQKRNSHKGPPFLQERIPVSLFHLQHPFPQREEVKKSYQRRSLQVSHMSQLFEESDSGTKKVQGTHYKLQRKGRAGVKGAEVEEASKGNIKELLK